jgi:non-specific serine/threonine protein kinase
LRVLATSRETLGVPGEIVFAVPPLSLPDPRRLPDAQGLINYEAAGLFVERARAVNPDFGITERNAGAIAQICYRLDGIPLAIEFAAVRTKVLSVQQIASRLDGSFALLTGGRRAMPHHRTLRATVGWSHGLLKDEERKLFARLSVFAGGFTLEGAEAVCAGGDIEQGEVLDLLASLVDKSLVLVTERDGVARYRLLEPVRQYGQERLEESGEEAEASRRHAFFFLAVAEEIEPRINTAGRRRWLNRLANEHDNLRAALAWSCAESPRGETGLRLAGALLWFWFHQGYLSEGRRWLEGALSIRDGIGGRAAPDLSAAGATVLCGAGLLAWMQGDQATARSRLEDSVRLWRELEDHRGLAQALRVLSHAMLGQGVPAVVRSLGEESVALFREVQDEFGLATSLATLGIIALTQEDYAAARASLEESVAISRKSGDDWALSLALRNSGIAALKQGDHERAATLLGESMVALQDPGGALGLVNLDLLAAAVSMRGDHEWAARLFGAAQTVREAVGVSVIPSIRADYDRGVAAARAGLGAAAFDTAWAEGQEMSLEQAVEYGLRGPEAPEESEKAPKAAYPAGLSAREVEVLRLVARGKTNVRIAEELYISPRTVNGHLGSAYRKIGSNTRAEAARFASEHDLLP